MLDEEGNNAMCRGEGIQRGFPVQNFLLVSISWPDIVFGKPKCSLKWALYYAHSKLMLQSFSEWLLSWEYIHIFAFIPNTLTIALEVALRIRTEDTTPTTPWCLHICCQCWPVWRSRDIYWYLHIAPHAAGELSAGQLESVDSVDSVDIYCKTPALTGACCAHTLSPGRALAQRRH